MAKPNPRSTLPWIVFLKPEPDQGNSKLQQIGFLPFQLGLPPDCTDRQVILAAVANWPGRVIQITTPEGEGLMNDCGTCWVPFHNKLDPF